MFDIKKLPKLRWADYDRLSLLIVAGIRTLGTAREVITGSQPYQWEAFTSLSCLPSLHPSREDAKSAIISTLREDHKAQIKALDALDREMLTKVYTRKSLYARKSLDDCIKLRNRIQCDAENAGRGDEIWQKLGVANRHIEHLVQDALRLTPAIDDEMQRCLEECFELLHPGESPQ